MITRKQIIFIFLLLFPFAARGENNPEKTLEFEGYVISDSLEYSAETIDYLFDNNKVIMKKNANIKYLGRILESNTINYYQDYEYMEAVGIQDSTGKYVNTPKFKDKSGEELKGLKIKYDLGTQEGFISSGRTQYEKGFMTADVIKRASEDTLYISNGTYTTCDLEDPHYYFYGKKMKFILNDKLIIKPIIGYVHDIPVFWFPFYVFPISKGRQSGFLTPKYGSSRLDGRYFSNIGYYFAPSDYYDYRFASTFRERNGWLVKNWFNYKKMYSLQGSIYGSFEDEERNDSRQWKLSGSHSHTISPTLSISGRGNFQSSEYSQNNSNNLYQRLNRNMNSNLTIRKKWSESGNSLITNIKNTRNLDTNQRTTVVPSISFTMPKRLIFGSKENESQKRKYTQKGSETDLEKTKEWYNSLYYSMNTKFTGTEKRDEEALDSINNLYFTTSVSSSHKLLGWLTTNPSIKLSEQFVASNDSISHVRTDNISAGLSLSTKVYGTFNPRIGSLVGLRHVITPTISYSYGKEREYQGLDSDVFYRFDKNDNDKSQRSSMSVSLRNLFQTKTVKGGEEKKTDIVSLDFSSGVDFEADTQPVSPLKTTLVVKPMEIVDVTLRSSHTFYHDDDTFHLFSPYLKTMSINTTIGLSDKTFISQGTSSRVNANNDLGRDVFDSDIDENVQKEMSADKSSSSIPFKLQFTHNYQISKSTKKASGGYKYRKTHTIKPTISFSPSRNFYVQYYMYYDIEDESISSHRVIVKRDLHCWEANLSWIPSGIREGFYFLVNIKDLPDVKIEKRRGASSLTG